MCHQRGGSGQQCSSHVPYFITHVEYFVRYEGSGGGYSDVFDLSSYKLLSGWRQCGGSAAAAAWQRRAAWRRCWQCGGGGSRVVAARRGQRSGGSVAVVAVRWQRGGGQRGGGVSQCGGSPGAGSVVAVSAARRQPRWQHACGGRLGSCGRSFAALQHQRRQQSGLPLRAATVATKTPAATAMAGALPTINNHLKAAVAMVMETTTTTMNKT